MDFLFSRDLAKSFSVPWREHWPFLNCFADFSKRSGLQKLEEFFRVKLQSRKTASESNLLLKKKALGYNRGYFSIQNRTNTDMKGILFGSASRTSEPDSLVKNLFKDFDQSYKEPIDSHSAKKPLNSDFVRSCVEDLEQSFAGMSLGYPLAKAKQHVSSHIDDQVDIENKRDCAPIDSVPSVPRVPTGFTPPDGVLTPVSRCSQGASNSSDGFSEHQRASTATTTVGTPCRNVPHTHRSFFIHGYDLFYIFVLE